jgi:hypothetical protein
MRDGHHQPQPSKKRSHGPAPVQGQPKAAQSHPDVSAVAREPPGPGFMQRSSTFPHQGPKSEPGSFVGSPWSSNSVTSPYGSATPNSAAFDQRMFQQDFSGSSSNPMQHQSQQPMSLPPNFANPAIPDVSAMMFPSGGDEPLLYPNQPLTTFENNQQFMAAAAAAAAAAASGNKPSNQFMANVANGGTSIDSNTGTPLSQPRHLFPNSPPSRNGRDDNMEAQFFALPQYLEQSRAHQRHCPPTSFPPDNMGFNGGPQMTSNPSHMGRMSNGWPQNQQQQQQSPFIGQAPQGFSNDINIQDLFGGAEWNAMIMDPGFRQ